MGIQMDIELTLAVLGIALTVLFGLSGFLAVKKKKSQKQINKNGTSIQAGRDVNIGVNIDDK